MSEKRDKTTVNDGKFKKGNKIGRRITKDNQPSGERKRLGKALKKAFREVTQETLWNLQGKAIAKMAEWVEQKLDDLDTLSTAELEKIQKFLEFLRDSSGQKPTDKQEITNTTPQIVVASESVKNKIDLLMSDANNN